MRCLQLTINPTLALRCGQTKKRTESVLKPLLYQGFCSHPFNCLNKDCGQSNQKNTMGSTCSSAMNFFMSQKEAVYVAIVLILQLWQPHSLLRVHVALLNDCWSSEFLVAAKHIPLLWSTLCTSYFFTTHRHKVRSHS